MYGLFDNKIHLVDMVLVLHCQTAHIFHIDVGPFGFDVQFGYFDGEVKLGTLFKSTITNFLVYSKISLTVSVRFLKEVRSLVSLKSCYSLVRYILMKSFLNEEIGTWRWHLCSPIASPSAYSPSATNPYLYASFANDR